MGSVWRFGLEFGLFRVQGSGLGSRFSGLVSSLVLGLRFRVARMSQTKWISGAGRGIGGPGAGLKKKPWVAQTSWAFLSASLQTQPPKWVTPAAQRWAAQRGTLGDAKTSPAAPAGQAPRPA